MYAEKLETSNNKVSQYSLTLNGINISKKLFGKQTTLYAAEKYQDRNKSFVFLICQLLLAKIQACSSLVIGHHARKS